MLLCKLSCVLRVCVVLFFPFNVPDGCKKMHIRGKKYENCFRVNESILSVDICAQRCAFLFRRAFWLLAAMLAGSIASSFA